MNWILGVLAAVIATLLLALGSQPAHAAGAPADSNLVHGCAYDAHIFPNVVTNGRVERGPPANLATHPSGPAVDMGSYGRFARPDAGASAVIYTYDSAARLVLVANGGPTGVEVAVRPVGDLSSLQRAQVAAEGVVPRFIGNAAGDLLDTSRVTIPEGKFGYLLKNPSKAGVFRDSMGLDEGGLDSALRNHLTTNFGSASESVPMTGGGTKFIVRGPMTGPSGQTWNITTAWGVDLDGTIRLITATP